MTRRGDKTVVLLLIFLKLMMLELELAPGIENKFNRLPWCHRASPSTTRYESVKSTDTDTMMLKLKSVNKFLSEAGTIDFIKVLCGRGGFFRNRPRLFLSG
jgi:hypothetical protein